METIGHRWILLLKLVAYTYLVLVPLLAYSEQGTVTGTEQVVTITNAFLRQVGWKIAPTLVPDVKDERLLVFHSWRITLGEYHVEINPENGQMKFAYPIQNIHENSEIMHPEVFDDKQALALALQYISDAGIELSEQQYVIERIEPIRSGTKAYTEEWKIVLRRKYHDYVFSRDFIRVCVNKLDGRLNSLKYYYRQPLPESFEVRASAEGAETIARAFFAEQRVLLGNVKINRLEIVSPSNYWQVWLLENEPKPEVTQVKTRLAWAIYYDGPWSTTLVYVDAFTGEIIGGLKTMEVIPRQPKATGNEPMTDTVDAQ